MTAGDLATDLLRPEAYPAPYPGHVELRETHLSRVFLTEGDVFKVKKAVRFAFLDFTSLEARQRACEAEIVLNSRLSAGTYLGLVPVRLDDRGRHHLGPEGEVVDWAIHMLRLPDAFRGDQRLAAGTLDRRHLEAVAIRIAELHGRAGASPMLEAWGTRDAVARNVRESFAEVDAGDERLLTIAQQREVVSWQLDFLREHGEIFARRLAEGRVREGHGDLRLEHVYLGERGELTIIDCLEFDPRYRWADTCADVAFFSMDLAAHGRVDLAERFLALYARATDDYGLYAVVDFYEAYRAYIRGKIATLTARNGNSEARDAALAEARRYFALSLSAGRRSLLDPAVVAVGGVIASGKSTIAEELGERLSAPVIDADRTRKRLLGLPATFHDTSSAFEGPAYNDAATDRVYTELMVRADAVLASGRPVVLDASFRSATLRQAARDLAAKHGVPFCFVECRAHPETCRDRLRTREHEVSVSDGRLEIFDAFLARMVPSTELPAAERLVLDTEVPLEETMRLLERHLRTWPARFTM